MSPKRGDRVAAPPGPEEWQIRFHTTEAAKGWEELCRQAAGNTRVAWMAMRQSPAPRVESLRHHRLSGGLAEGLARGRVLDRWQIEVTGAAGSGTSSTTRPPPSGSSTGPGHPKATD